jgi:exodeoxyribonuclease-3
MFRIITLNLNGIRSAAKKGFFQWFAQQNADVLCLQETKAQEHQLGEIIHPENYHYYFFDAEKKGYSGVAIYTRHKPDKIITGLGFDYADKEGRYIQIDLGKLSIVSLYLPSGTTGEERQKIKYAFLDFYKEVLKKQREQGREYVICGDWNIAHKNIDIKNWRGNQKNSGFLPEERAWLDEVFGTLGYIDAFRVINQQEDQYTWWSNRGQAYAKNVGWRIDYQVVTPGLKDKIKAVSIYKDQKFSDHAPLIMDYEIDFL